MFARLLWMMFLPMGMLTQAGAQTVVPVADGDCTALNAALAANSADGNTTITLARGGHYECGVAVDRGTVLLEGAGASLQTTLCASTLLHVSAGARLHARNIRISSPSCGQVAPPPREIYNEGSVELDAVTVDVTQVDNRASMSLRNVTVSGSLSNQGRLSIAQSTVFDGAIYNPTGAILFLSNTLFTSDLSPPDCAVAGSGQVRSLGGNAISRACTFASAADVVWTTPPELDALKDNGGLVATRALPSGSPLRGKGVARHCEATDARGLVRPKGACDVGAYEVAGGSQGADIGGMNGFYFDRDANGHYVTIQRLHDEFVLVTWSTFDRSGNQAWIYGVGVATGRTIHVTMSQNVDGRLQPGGPAMGSSVTEWGSVDIALAGCAGGTFAYSSKLPAFGSGQFRLDRLASVAEVGCVD